MINFWDDTCNISAKTATLLVMCSYSGRYGAGCNHVGVHINNPQGARKVANIHVDKAGS